MKTSIYAAVALIGLAGGAYAGTAADQLGNLAADVAISKVANKAGPVPLAVTLTPGALAAPGSVLRGKKVLRQCYIVELSISPALRGENSAVTKAKVERAFAAQKLKIARYTDDLAVTSFRFSAPRPKVQTGFFSTPQGQVRKALKAIPGVESVSFTSQTNTAMYGSVELTPGLYPDRLKRVFSPVVSDISYNPAYDVLDVGIESGSSDPVALAKTILTTMPDTIKVVGSGLLMANILIYTYYQDGSDGGSVAEVYCEKGSGNCRSFAR